ncbi:MAG: pyruvate synthase subunit beta [Deltaproteobacteria bacterium]|jgi:pyruvate ferredoxin oxidoreductase beta subunit|nr:pyruvate synthase subunit beta [Deltaproteobacteria bacterium]MBW2245952.1 pyruvate synthase subunit beta [Deltaproteobacteria bacterium]MBW2598266.1 pyruvate synthase subunit beta [Deltaproteobacteria bacterium]MBW2639732.1 pyruvate synthase subunit beta [Deltaproteobacteria bacterium]MBW2679575.1 pyruvate synthase subunit beta [Deltaproteobacteria bacterium]
MERFNVYASRLITKKEYFSPGHRACQGCAEALAVRLVAKALGQNVIVSSATGCMEIVSSPLPFTNWRVPWIHVAFENTSAVASGVEGGTKALIRKGKLPDKGTVFLGMGGDGATTDIGLQSLSGAFERGHNFLYVCYDNEAYMNTGIQRSSSTPFGAATTTSPAGKLKPGQITWKKNMGEIAVAHNIPYVATACSSYPFDLIEKVKKAARIEGPAYVHVLSVCPTGWRIPPNKAIWIGRLAVETGVFPLYEVENGKYRITVDVPELKPVLDYLKPQGRFRHLTPELVDQIQERVTREYNQLKAKTAL